MDGRVASAVVPIFSVFSFAVAGVCLVPNDLAASLLVVFLTPISCSFFSDTNVSGGDLGDESEIAGDEEIVIMEEDESFEPDSFSSFIERGASFASFTGSSALTSESEVALR